MRDRLRHARQSRMRRKHCSAIIPAIRNFRPTIIHARLNNIEFIPTFGPMFCFPEHTRFRVNNSSLWIAVSITIDRRIGTLSINERVILWDRAIAHDTVNFTIRLGQVLRHLFIAAVSNTEIKMPFIIKSNPRTKMMS